LGTAVRHVFIGVIRIYQRYISRWTPASCRFTPTCSEYAAQAIEKYGPIRGGGMAFLRICRCHPFHPGGHDPVR
jgi:putative membrane protein insertion efficiency factor